MLIPRPGGGSAAVMVDPGGMEGTVGGAWAVELGEDGARFKLEELFAAEALLLGRVTYEGFAQAWPSTTDEVGFAERMNGLPKYVASNTLKKADWNNSTILSGDIVSEVFKLKQQDGGEILVQGSGQLVGTLGPLGLVDEFRLMVAATNQPLDQGNRPDPRDRRWRE